MGSVCTTTNPSGEDAVYASHRTPDISSNPLADREQSLSLRRFATEDDALRVTAEQRQQLFPFGNRNRGSRKEVVCFCSCRQSELLFAGKSNARGSVVRQTKKKEEKTCRGIGLSTGIRSAAAHTPPLCKRNRRLRPWIARLTSDEGMMYIQYGIVSGCSVSVYYYIYSRSIEPMPVLNEFVVLPQIIVPHTSELAFQSLCGQAKPPTGALSHVQDAHSCYLVTIKVSCPAC